MPLTLMSLPLWMPHRLMGVPIIINAHEERAMKLTTEQKKLIDRYGELVSQYAPVLDEMERIKKALGALVKDDHDPQEITLTGKQYAVDYSAPSVTNQLAVSPEEFVLRTQAWKAVNISVTAAEQLITSEQWAQFFTKVPGSRRFKRVRALVAQQPLSAPKKLKTTARAKP